MLCWARCSFTTETSSVPIRYCLTSARVPASCLWVLQITLIWPVIPPSQAETLWPFCPNPAGFQQLWWPLWIWPIGCKCLQPPCCWAEDLPGRPPTMEQFEVLVVPAGVEEEEVLYSLAACWVKPVGLSSKRKRKRLLSTFFFFPSHSFPLMLSKSEGQNWMPAFTVHLSVIKTTGESVDVPCSLLVPLLNSQRCWPTVASLCNEFPQPSQTSNCVWDHQPRTCVVMS